MPKRIPKAKQPLHKTITKQELEKLYNDNDTDYVWRKLGYNNFAGLYRLLDKHGIPRKRPGSRKIPYSKQQLTTLFRKHGSRKAVALALRRGQKTVGDWYRRYGLTNEKMWLSPAERQRKVEGAEYKPTVSRKKLKKMYWEMSLTDLVRTLGVNNHGVVYAWLDHYGIKRKRRMPKQIAKEPKKPPVSRKKLVKLYENLSIKELCDILNVSVTTLYRWLENYGIELKAPKYNRKKEKAKEQGKWGERSLYHLNKKKLNKEYHHLTQQEFCEKYNCSHAELLALVDELGVTRKTQKRDKGFHLLTKRELKQEYGEKSINQIAAKYGVGKHTVRDRMVDFGIRIRERGEMTPRRRKERGLDLPSGREYRLVPTKKGDTFELVEA